MSFFEDLVKDIDVKPSKSKLVIRWIIRISIFLISGAFIVGEFNVANINDLQNLKESVELNNNQIIELKNDINNNLVDVNKRIDKIYSDGYSSFLEYQIYNNKQLELIIDYGETNKELLKRMISINSIESSKSLENKLEENSLEYISKNLKTNTEQYEEMIFLLQFNNKHYLKNYQFF
jgi:uncharacterized LabA/DUF88 family protein